ncbi:hypothetical protein [Oceanithermus sp.]
MKRIRVITLLAVALFSLAAAQSLPALTPPGAAGGIYTRNLSIKKAYFVNFQAEWNRLGISDLFFDLLKNDGEVTQEDIDEVSKFLTVDVVGREAILTFYADGNFFFMTRPSAEKTKEILSAIRKQMESPEKRGGWLIEESDEGDLKVISGVSSDAILIASKGAAERFFNGDRGLKMPVNGDLAIWLEPEPLWVYLNDPDLGLPPDAVKAIKTFTGMAGAVNIETDGVHSNSSFCFDPSQDADLAGIFLTNESAWNLADLPRGISATTGVVDLPALGSYVSRWMTELGLDMTLDLSSFGKRYALIDAGSQDPQQALQNPLGNLLLLLETKDSLTAEVTLLSWLQMAASFATAEGEGGFSVEPITVDGHDGKAVQLGMAGTLYLVSYDDRLALATSKEALNLLSAPKLGSDPEFTRLVKMLPPNYVGASYGNYRKTFEQVAQLLPLTMMQTIDDAETQQLMAQLSAKLGQFFKFVAERTGSAIGYTIKDGSCLASSGFTQVNW